MEKQITKEDLDDLKKLLIEEGIPLTPETMDSIVESLGSKNIDEIREFQRLQKKARENADWQKKQSLMKSQEEAKAKAIERIEALKKKAVSRNREERKKAKRKKKKHMDTVRRQTSKTKTRYLPGDVTKPWLRQFVKVKTIDPGDVNPLNFEKITNEYQRK